MTNDYISRLSAIDELDKGAWGVEWDKALAKTMIESLPSAQPERKKGKWIDRSNEGRILHPWWESCKCDQCGYRGSAAWNYCPNCGADMKET